MGSWAGRFTFRPRLAPSTSTRMKAWILGWKAFQSIPFQPLEEKYPEYDAEIHLVGRHGRLISQPFWNLGRDQRRYSVLYARIPGLEERSLLLARSTLER